MKLGQQGLYTSESHSSDGVEQLGTKRSQDGHPTSPSPCPKALHPIGEDVDGDVMEPLVAGLTIGLIGAASFPRQASSGSSWYMSWSQSALVVISGGCGSCVITSIISEDLIRESIRDE